MLRFKLETGAVSALRLAKYFEIVRDNLVKASGTEIEKKLSDAGAKSAEAAYGFPVTSEVIADQGIVKASHDGLSFLEFGAGMATDDNHPFTGDVPYPVYRGSYSDAHNGMYKLTGYKYWYFGNRLYFQIVPRYGMLEASRTMHREAEQVLKDVIKV